DVARQVVLLDRADPLVEPGPHHHPAVGEVVLVAAHLPDAVVALVEASALLLEHRRLQPPGVAVLRLAAVPQLAERDEHLADDVGLVLPHRTVADPHRPGTGIPPEVRELALGEVT